MKNSEIKNKVLNDIKQLKLQAEMLADKNLANAFKDENFKTNYKKMKALKFNIAKKEFLNEPVLNENNELKISLQNLQELAYNLGYKLSDFEPNYSCKKCNDTGIISDKFCDCYYKKLNKEIINNLGINVDNSHNFKNANFNLFDNPQTMQTIYSKLENWCNLLPKTEYKIVLISGDTGVGKTYLVDCICNNLIEKNLVVNYYSAFALSDLFLKYRTSFNENKTGLLDGVLSCDVLIIDDLGSEPNMKNNEEYFYLLFNERLNKNKFTIITTNLTLDQIRIRYGERTFSRLRNKACSTAIQIKNSDLRIKNTKK